MQLSLSQSSSLSCLDRLPLILNFAARALSKTPRFTHTSPVLKSLHWLKNGSMHSLQNSLTHIQNTPISEALLFAQSSENSILHLHSFFYHFTLKRPTVSSRLKITDRSFTHHASVLWNALPKELCQPALHSSHACQSGSTPLDLSSSQFHSKLKTHLFHKSFPP